MECNYHYYTNNTNQTSKNRKSFKFGSEDSTKSFSRTRTRTKSFSGSKSNYFKKSNVPSLILKLYIIH